MKNLYAPQVQEITSYPLSRILQIATENNIYQGKLMQIGMLEGSKRKMNMPLQWKQIWQLTADGKSTTKKTTLQAEERRKLFELKNGNIMKKPLCRQKGIDLKKANSEGKKIIKSKLESNPGSGLLSRNFSSKDEESEDVKFRKQMKRVETWLEENQKYQEFWMGGQEGGDDEIVIGCPTWMKTAAEMRSNRTTRSRNLFKGANSEGGRDMKMDEDLVGSCAETISGRITSPKPKSAAFQDHNIQEQFHSITGSASECKTGQSASSSKSQRRDGETRLVQRIEKTGADLSLIFEDEGDADKAIIITCCFERCEYESSQEPIGILTRRKVRKYDSSSMDISSKNTNSEF